MNEIAACVETRSALRSSLIFRRTRTPGRIVRDQALGVRHEIEDVEQLRGPPTRLGRRNPAQPARVLQQLLAAEPLEQPRLGRNDPDQRLGRDRIDPHVHAVDQDAPVVRPQQPRQHRQRGGLARAVRPDQPGEGARVDRQVDPGHRLLRAEPLPQALDGDGDRAHLTRLP